MTEYEQTLLASLGAMSMQQGEICRLLDSHGKALSALSTHQQQTSQQVRVMGEQMAAILAALSKEPGAGSVRLSSKPVEGTASGDDRRGLG